MKIIFPFIVLICSLNVFSQNSDLEERYRKQESKKLAEKRETNLESRGLDRFFFDGSIGAGFLFEYGYYPNNEYGIVSNLRVGNNFYLGKGNNPMIIRLTYLRLGFAAKLNNGGIYMHIVSPQFGLAKHIKFNETASMEPGVHLGYIFAGEFPPSSGISSIGFAVVPEIKFNISKITIGIEYGTRSDTHGYAYNSSKSYGRYHYIGLSIGGRFGRN